MGAIPFSLHELDANQWQEVCFFNENLLLSVYPFGYSQFMAKNTICEATLTFDKQTLINLSLNQCEHLCQISGNFYDVQELHRFREFGCCLLFLLLM